MRRMIQREVEIGAGGARLQGILTVAEAPGPVVLFAHGSGSGRHSPRNQQVARAIHDAGIGTLLFDLLTPEEERADRYTAHLRFDIGMLADRLEQATRWLLEQSGLRITSAGYFGASTGGAAALIAAAALQEKIGAVVSRGGRPDLAGEALPNVTSPTLLIVGERDETVLELNRLAYAQLTCTRELAVVPRATHLFEEPGALERVAELAVEWFGRYLPLELDGGTREDRNRRRPPA
jgi:pimeloyl-ACP methyl ester carboxylesterase